MSDEKPLRVVLLSDRLDRPGGGAYARELARSLRECGHEVFLLLTELPAPNASFDLPVRLCRHVVAWTAGGAMRKWLLGELESFGPEVLHAAEPRLGTVGQQIAQKLGIPSIVTVQPSGGRDWSVLDLENSWVIVSSETMREDLVKRLAIPEEDIAVVYPGVPVKPGQIPEASPPRRTPVIGTVGPLEFAEGQRFLLQAARKVTDRGLDVQVLIVGLGVEKVTLRKQAADLGLDQAVTFSDDMARPREVIDVMDVFVMSATREVLSPMLLEAMSVGKPVVATAAGDIVRVVQDGRTGLTFPKGDVDALAAAIERLLREPELALRLAREGRELVRREFSVGRMVQNTVAVYRALAGRPIAKTNPTQSS